MQSDGVFRGSKNVVSSTSFNGHRQTILCSATIPQRKYFAEFCYRNGWTEQIPKLIDFSQDQLLPDNIEHEIVVCAKENRLKLAAYFLKEHFGSVKDHDDQQCILFVDNEDNLLEYAEFLGNALQATETLSVSKQKHSWRESAIAVLSAKMNIDHRRLSLLNFRDSNAKILLCTDLATRGIDVPATSLVIQVKISRCSLKMDCSFLCRR